MALLRVGSNRSRVKALEAGFVMAFEIVEAVGEAPRSHVGISREGAKNLAYCQVLTGS
jgi:hypothetical protein